MFVPEPTDAYKEIFFPLAIIFDPLETKLFPLLINIVEPKPVQTVPLIEYAKVFDVPLPAAMKFVPFHITPLP